MKGNNESDRHDLMKKAALLWLFEGGARTIAFEVPVRTCARRVFFTDTTSALRRTWSVSRSSRTAGACKNVTLRALARAGTKALVRSTGFVYGEHGLEIVEQSPSDEVVSDG